MKVKEAITLFQYYQRSSYKERTIQSYLHLLKKFESFHGERPLSNRTVFQLREHTMPVKCMFCQDFTRW